MKKQHAKERQLLQQLALKFGYAMLRVPKAQRKRNKIDLRKGAMTPSYAMTLIVPEDGYLGSLMIAQDAKAEAVAREAARVSREKSAKRTRTRGRAAK